MRIHGKIKHWNHQKAYGFITPASGEKEVFVHVRAFLDRSHQPDLNQSVTFELSTDRQGRPCAAKVALLGEEPARRFGRKVLNFSLLASLGFFGVVAVSAVAGALPSAVLILYCVASAISYLVYAWDKAAARRGGWRTNESTLHLLALLGGWPGAMLAQQTLRHKSIKKEFRVMFWFTVVLNCAVFTWLFTDSGAATLRTLLQKI